MTVLANLRKSYEKAVLDEAQAPAEPWPLFSDWLHQAIESGIPEPNAMTLATVGEHNRPSTRIVLIKQFDTGGITWFTNYQSRKGQELLHNPFAALQFHWVELERMVRIEGQVEKVSAAESDAYFASRPLNSRLGAWTSEQSQVIASRQILETAWATFQAQFGENPPRPPQWGGYRLKPDYFEFWQGRPSRLHDRLAYRLKAGAWRLERLAP